TKALDDYNEAIRIDPKYARPMANKAYLLATCKDDKLRDGKKALELAKEACGSTKKKNGWYLSALAASHAELQQFDEAVRIERQAVEDRDYFRNAEDPEEPERAKQRFRSYEQKKPWRE